MVHKTETIIATLIGRADQDMYMLPGMATEITVPGKIVLQPLQGMM